MSPAALRAHRGARRPADGRWIPDFLSLPTALENSRKDQTYNTPGDRHAAPARRPARLDARPGRPRRDGAAHDAPRARTSTAGPRRTSTRRRSSPTRPSARSSSGTIDFDDDVDAAALAATLRANGIVDVEPYRKLGRNQLRVAMFPATDPADVQALTACIDWVLERSSDDASARRREDRRLRRRAAARALRRRPRRRLGPRRARAADRRLRRDPHPLGDQARRRPAGQGDAAARRRPRRRRASTTSTSRRPPSAASSSPTRRSPTSSPPPSTPWRCCWRWPATSRRRTPR